MKLKELINKYLQSLYSKAEAQSYISHFDINVKLSIEVTNFIEKFKNEEIISEEKFLHFSEHLSKLNEDIQKCIIHLLYDISLKIYNTCKDDIDEAVNSIENNPKAGHEISKSSGKDATKYIGLLNCYQLFAHHISIEKGHYSYSYPGILFEAKNAVRFDLPFAINALRLVGKLPTIADFNGIDLSKAYYPLSLKVVKNDKVPLRKGIKKSEEYYPYKMVSKIAKGDTGDNTFLATNGKKILFIRGVEHYSPKAILSSKIATLISPTHFSSERLLDNRLVGSRGIAAYARSVADARTCNDRKKYLEQEKRVFPGSGIIDEVTNFVCETDINIENYGFSSENVYKSHV